MALSEAASNRRIHRGVAPVQITLAGTVATGDPIMYSTGFKLAANTSGAPAILFAGQPGVSGDIITAYGMAVIELSHTAANVPTMGQIIAVADAGTYSAASGGLQDIGYVIEIDTDNLHSRALVCGMITEVDTAGT